MATNGVASNGVSYGISNGISDGVANGTSGEVQVLCGPLLNYRHMTEEHTDHPIWHGSVLIVTTPNQRPDALRLTFAGPQGSASLDRSIRPERLYEDLDKAFFRYQIEMPFQEQESAWSYTIPHMVSVGSHSKPGTAKPNTFFIPSKHESMRIMFHSCNGFSVGTDMELWKGPSLWNDVLRVHAEQPFHVMIGGGDQIYNDSVRTDGPLKPWTDIPNPRKRRDFPFDEDMRIQCDVYYFENYVKWYSTEAFAAANGQIPQLNIWDDHDIIDGFGSYTDHFMKCPVFRGIGGVAHKYYMLFQQHLAPPANSFTTVGRKAGKSLKSGPTALRAGNTPAPAVQEHKNFVFNEPSEGPSYILGKRAGPYVEERSRNMYCQLGKHIAFAGIDARTERTRHQVNYPDTYELFFNRINSSIKASNGEIKHLILLLGVPIAYPRLQWLENILQSPIIGPIKFLNKRFGVAGGLFNQFDGGVDLVDDLDDHYTAHQHKAERKELIHRIQNTAKENSVRVTILGGDVHLSAFGRFYSNPKLNIPAERDFRYIANIVSSAITNKPPPAAVANLLAKRNKIHHLDHDTDETLMELFDKQPGEGEPGVKPKGGPTNHATMPSRNYAIISESHTHMVGATEPTANGHVNGAAHPDSTDFKLPENPRHPLHKGEEGAGSSHAAAQGVKKTGLAGLYGLDVAIRVEKNPADTDGHTHGYGLSIPALDSEGYKNQGRAW